MNEWRINRRKRGKFITREDEKGKEEKGEKKKKKEKRRMSE